MARGERKDDLCEIEANQRIDFGPAEGDQEEKIKVRKRIKNLNELTMFI
jgi:hypothetical protein